MLTKLYHHQGSVYLTLPPLYCSDFCKSLLVFKRHHHFWVHPLQSSLTAFMGFGLNNDFLGPVITSFNEKFKAASLLLPQLPPLPLKIVLHFCPFCPFWSCALRSQEECSHFHSIPSAWAPQPLPSPSPSSRTSVPEKAGLASSVCVHRRC